MRYEISQQQLNFFTNHGYIEFEDLLNDSEANQLSLSIDQVLENRLTKPINKQTAKTLFDKGRDLFRDSPFIRSFSTKRSFATYASQLVRTRNLRLTYDQAIRTGTKELTGEKIFPNFFAEKTRLDQISCFQGLYLGLIINLNPDNAQEEEEIQVEGVHQLIPYPRRLGSGIFIRRSTPLYLEPLFQKPNRSFFLIVYSHAKTLYILNENDPHTQSLKNLGYGFGDHLKDESHPIVY